MDGKYQNSIPQLAKLNAFRYERIFKMHSTEQNQYYYNLLQSIYLPDEIDESKLFYLTIKENLPWTTISYNAYGNIELWWLIMLTNKIYNPLKSVTTGTVLKFIKPQYIQTILKEISNSLN